VLAATLLHERVHRAQAVGLALCAGAVVLVAGG
jgi:drug/metabolite transporter (DMT)-like permease